MDRVVLSPASHPAATRDRFLIARNPDAGSKLPYLLRLPIDGGLILRAREPYPTTSRVYCFDAADDWPNDAELIEELEVASCRQRGAAIDLVLARSRLNRSQFVFTNLRNGRPAIFWQTPQTTRRTKPGARMPKRRAAGLDDFVIVVDTRERYAYRFQARPVSIDHKALACGDYAVVNEEGEIVSAVERKRLEDLVATLVDGSLQFALAELAELPRAAVVVEGDYGDLLKLRHVQPGFVLDLLARLQARYPSVPIVFAGARKLAEEYTYRFLGATLAEAEA